MLSEMSSFPIIRRLIAVCVVDSHRNSNDKQFKYHYRMNIC